MTGKKSAATESLLYFYDQAMGMCNMKEGTRCTHDDVVEAIKSAITYDKVEAETTGAIYVDKAETILRTLRRYRKRPNKS